MRGGVMRGLPVFLPYDVEKYRMHTWNQVKMCHWILVILANILEEVILPNEHEFLLKNILFQNWLDLWTRLETSLRI